MQGKSMLARLAGAAAIAFGGLSIGRGVVQLRSLAERSHSTSRAQRRAEYIANTKRWRNRYAPFAYTGAKLARKAAAGRIGLGHPQ